MRVNGPPTQALCPGSQTGGQGLRPRLTLRRQEVSQQHEARDEHAGHDDVNDVEERLPADDQRVDDVTVARAISGAGLAADDARAEVDGPFAVLYGTERGRAPGESRWTFPWLHVPITPTCTCPQPPTCMHTG